jgi:hypothetical protein
MITPLSLVESVYMITDISSRVSPCDNGYFEQSQSLWQRIFRAESVPVTTDISCGVSPCDNGYFVRSQSLWQRIFRAESVPVTTVILCRVHKKKWRDWAYVKCR